MVDGTDIYQTDYAGNRQIIGKTLSTYNELEQTTTEYYNKLVLDVALAPHVAFYKESRLLLRKTKRVDIFHGAARRHGLQQGTDGPVLAVQKWDQRSGKQVAVSGF